MDTKEKRDGEMNWVVRPRVNLCCVRGGGLRLPCEQIDRSRGMNKCLGANVIARDQEGAQKCHRRNQERKRSHGTAASSA